LGRPEASVPYLRFKGFEEELLREMLPELLDQFSRIAVVPLEIIKIELHQIAQITATPRSLEIFMFPRAQEKHDAIAAVLHAMLERHDCREVHIFFVLLTPSLYYKQGEPLKDATWLTGSNGPPWKHCEIFEPVLNTLIAQVPSFAPTPYPLRQVSEGCLFVLDQGHSWPHR
jgi:hypothetical protein